MPNNQIFTNNNNLILNNLLLQQNNLNSLNNFNNINNNVYSNLNLNAANFNSAYKMEKKGKDDIQFNLINENGRKIIQRNEVKNN